MRRPTPLPTAPAATDEQAGPAASPRRIRIGSRRGAGDQSAGDSSAVTEDLTTPEASGTDRDAAVATEGILDPYAETVPLGSDPSKAGLTTPKRPEPVDNAPPPLRLRDVWGAARARRSALRAEVRRFTERQRRRRRAWAIGVLGVTAVIAGVVGAAYSPLFAVQRVLITGTQTLDPALLEQALASQLGTPLALIDDAAIQKELVAFPMVQSYSLQAQPPHDLVVQIVERDPIGYVQTSVGFDLVDAAGVVVGSVPERDGLHPLIEATGGPGSAPFAAIGEVIRTLPEPIRLQVTAVTATTRDDITLRIDVTDTDVVWGSAADSALKAVVLQTAMTSRPPGTVRVYDVSSPEAIVIR